MSACAPAFGPVVKADGSRLGSGGPIVPQAPASPPPVVSPRTSAPSTPPEPARTPPRSHRQPHPLPKLSSGYSMNVTFYLFFRIYCHIHPLNSDLSFTRSGADEGEGTYVTAFAAPRRFSASAPCGVRSLTLPARRYDAALGCNRVLTRLQPARRCIGSAGSCSGVIQRGAFGAFRTIWRSAGWVPAGCRQPTPFRPGRTSIRRARR